MTIRGIWAWINKSHFKNPHSEEINIYRHIWPSTDECTEVAVIWCSWIDLLFELRICILSFSGTGLGLTGVCWCVVISQATAQLATAGAEPGVGTSGKAAAVGQGISLHVALQAVMCVCVCAWMMNPRMKISCWSSLSWPMPREEKLPNLFILPCCYLSTFYSPELTAAAFPVINICSQNCTFGILPLFSYFLRHS